MAPAEERGKLNSVFDVSINLGILLGYVTGFVIHMVSPDNWRLMLGCGAILPIIVLALLAALPETPHYSVMANQSQQALHDLQRLGHDKDEAEETIRDMQKEIRKDRQKSTKYCSPGLQLSVGFGFFQQIAGSEAILYYTADFLDKAGLTSPVMRLLGNCMVGLCKLLPELVTMKCVDTVGRRPIMLWSAFALFVFLSALSLAFYIGASATWIIALLCCSVGSFSIGLGPFTFLCVSENLSATERSMGVTYCAATNRFTSGLVALTVVSLYNVIGLGNLFAAYALLRLLSMVFYWYTPETAGMSLEEIQAAKASENSEIDNDRLEP